MDARTIYNRKRKLMAIQRKISKKRNRLLVGQEVPVLIRGISAESDLLWEARLATQAPEIDGVCYINDPGEIAPKPGQFRRMRITEAHDYDLIGALVDQPPADDPPANYEAFPILAANRVQLTPNSI